MKEKYFEMIDQCLEELFNETKNNLAITAESDLKCYLYSKLRCKLGDKFFFKKGGFKVPRLVSEFEYPNQKNRDNLRADLVLIDEKEILVSEDSMELISNLKNSVVIELKFADFHTIRAKQNRIYDDCAKVIKSSKVKKACVILWDIENSDLLKEKNISSIKEDILLDFKSNINGILLVFYYISKEGILKGEIHPNVKHNI